MQIEYCPNCGEKLPSPQYRDAGHWLIFWRCSCGAEWEVSVGDAGAPSVLYQLKPGK